MVLYVFFSNPNENNAQRLPFGSIFFFCKYAKINKNKYPKNIQKKSRKKKKTENTQTRKFGDVLNRGMIMNIYKK